MPSAEDLIDGSSFAALAELFGLDDAASMAWRALGSCVGRSDVNWFPERGASAAPAKAVCGSCPVREECLEAAMRNGEKHGIWGGLSERERRRLRRQRRNAVPAGVGGKILQHLEANGPHHGGLAELAHAVVSHPQTVKNLVVQMEAEGLLVVDPPAPRDPRRGRRVRVVALPSQMPAEMPVAPGALAGAR